MCGTQPDNFFATRILNIILISHREFTQLCDGYLAGQRSLEAISKNIFKTYFGQAMDLKRRIYQHRAAFKNENSQHQTALSKYIWKLKKSNRHFNIKWSIWARAPPFRGGKSCRLCLLEKLAIAECPPRKLLNNRSEILSKCIHRHKFELRKKAASTKVNQSQTNNNNAP